MGGLFSIGACCCTPCLKRMSTPKLRRRLMRAVLQGHALEAQGYIRAAAASDRVSRVCRHKSTQFGEALGMTPLQVAARDGHTAIVRAIVQVRWDECKRPTVDEGMTPIHYAARYGRWECLKTLLTCVPPFNEDDRADIVEGLVALQTRLEAQSPLHMAAFYAVDTGDLRGVLILMEDFSADFRYRNSFGKHAVDAAREYALKLQAELDARDEAAAASCSAACKARLTRVSGPARRLRVWLREADVLHPATSAFLTSGAGVVGAASPTNFGEGGGGGGGGGEALARGAPDQVTPMPGTRPMSSESQSGAQTALDIASVPVRAAEAASAASAGDGEDGGAAVVVPIRAADGASPGGVNGVGDETTALGAGVDAAVDTRVAAGTRPTAAAAGGGGGGGRGKRGAQNGRAKSTKPQPPQGPVLVGIPRTAVGKPRAICCFGKPPRRCCCPCRAVNGTVEKLAPMERFALVEHVIVSHEQELERLALEAELRWQAELERRLGTRTGSATSRSKTSRGTGTSRTSRSGSRTSRSSRGSRGSTGMSSTGSGSRSGGSITSRSTGSRRSRGARSTTSSRGGGGGGKRSTRRASHASRASRASRASKASRGSDKDRRGRPRDTRRRRSGRRRSSAEVIAGKRGKSPTKAEIAMAGAPPLLLVPVDKTAPAAAAATTSAAAPSGAVHGRRDHRDDKRDKDRRAGRHKGGSGGSGSARDAGGAATSGAQGAKEGGGAAASAAASGAAQTAGAGGQAAASGQQPQQQQKKKESIAGLFEIKEVKDGPHFEARELYTLDDMIMSGAPVASFILADEATELGFKSTVNAFEHLEDSDESVEEELPMYVRPPVRERWEEKQRLKREAKKKEAASLTPRTVARMELTGQSMKRAKTGGAAPGGKSKKHWIHSNPDAPLYDDSGAARGDPVKARLARRAQMEAEKAKKAASKRGID